MNTFIFVSIVCIGQSCGFMTSTDILSEKECQATKAEFLATKFDSKVTLAASQCMNFKRGYAV